MFVFICFKRPQLPIMHQISWTNHEQLVDYKQQFKTNVVKISQIKILLADMQHMPDRYSIPNIF